VSNIAFRTIIITLGVIVAAMAAVTRFGGISNVDGTNGITSTTQIGADMGLFISAGLVFILGFNLWFIGNRLQSDARIVAYIQLVHEGRFKDRWFGWENALREYRTIFKDKGAATSHRFYPMIWASHIIFVLLALLVSFIILNIIGEFGGSKGYISIGNQNVQLSSLSEGALLVALVFFAIYAFKFRPQNLSTRIELERDRWKEVLGRAAIDHKDHVEPSSPSLSTMPSSGPPTSPHQKE